MSYAFKEKRVAVGLKEIYESQPWTQRPAVGTREYATATTNWIFKTPSGGIPARNGNQCGSAECVLQYVNPDGILTEYISPETSTTQAVLVWNPFSSPVGGDRVITAKLVFGQIIVDAEDCQ